MVRFSRFVLDCDAGRLLCDGAPLPLSPKDCALLRYLATNPDRVIPHAELLNAVWAGTAVGPDVLKVRIARLRRLLADDPAAPRFIANVHGEGYRFLPQHTPPPLPAPRVVPAPLIGRDRQMAFLQDRLADAAQGRRQVLLVTGEAGIGKTTLIESFLASAATDRASLGAGSPAEVSLVVGRGQCIEHYGSGEPYLPVMEALSRLGRDDGNRALTRALQRYAPNWLQQLPALLDADERERLRQTGLPTRDGMIRELVEALEAYASPSGFGEPVVVVLVLEDLQWADGPTLDFLQMFARRPEPAHLVILGTYRPVEVLAPTHPLRTALHELRAHGSVDELELTALSEQDVARYIELHCPGHEFPEQLAPLVHRRTAGNPLFLRDALRELRERGVLVASGSTWTFHGDLRSVGTLMPSSIHHLLARQRDNLTETEQRLLEAGSLTATGFSAAIVAGMLNMSVTATEERCLDLAGRQIFIRAAGSEQWPDGTLSTRFEFSHALYQELWQARVGDSRRAEWHGFIASRKERAYGNRSPEIASELAQHFERGRDYLRAALYCSHASRVALQRGSSIEARVRIEHALTLLPSANDEPGRSALELQLQIGLGTIAALTEGFESSTAAKAFSRGHEICRATKLTPEVLEPLFGMCRFFWIRGERARSRELADQLHAVAVESSQPIRLMAACAARGTVLSAHGDVAASIRDLTQGVELAEEWWTDDLIGVYGGDLQIVCGATLANVLQLGGFPEQGLARLNKALEIGAARPTPMAAIDAYFGGMLFHRYSGDVHLVQQFADHTRRLVSEHGLWHFLPMADAHGGWATCMTGDPDAGLPLIVQAAETLKVSGARLFLPYVLGLQVDAQLRLGAVGDALTAIASALAIATANGPGLYDADLHRLSAEVRLASGDPEARRTAEDSLRQALAIAQQQKTRVFELSAAVSLGRLLEAEGKPDEARAVVDHASRWFTEGHD